MTRPLDSLAPWSTIARDLDSASQEAVAAELARLEGLSLDGLRIAALFTAKGLFALRRGDNHAAHTDLRRAAEMFRAAGDTHAATLVECDALVAEQRMSRDALPKVVAALRAIEATDDDLVFVTAAAIRGAAHVAAGEPEAAIDALAAAVRRSADLLPERVRALNTLGVLYSAIGQSGAATAALEHACELARRLGIATSEAIARGQLGSLALARGDLAAARGHFGAQELLAVKLGDRHGRARALTFLAEVALDGGQAATARELAHRARTVAEEAQPPLEIFAAFASLLEQRASSALGEAPSDDEVRALRQRFEERRVSLGVALVDAAQADPQVRRRAFERFASLGLTQRMATLLLASRGDTEDPRAIDESITVLAQLHPHLSDAHAADLLFLAPSTLGTVGARRLAAQRNLAKLAALHERSDGLVIAVGVSAESSTPALPDPNVRASLVGAMGAIRVWAWPIDTPHEVVTTELARLAAPPARSVVVVERAARLTTVPFVGEPFATLTGVDLFALMARAHELSP